MLSLSSLDSTKSETVKLTMTGAYKSTTDVEGIRGYGKITGIEPDLPKPPGKVVDSDTKADPGASNESRALGASDGTSLGPEADLVQ